MEIRLKRAVNMTFPPNFFYMFITCWSQKFCNSTCIMFLFVELISCATQLTEPLAQYLCFSLADCYICDSEHLR